MNENAQKWVDALRSGEYSRTEGTLRNEVGYCCLGVACDVYHKTTKKGKWNEALYFEVGRDQSFTTLPPPVMTWLGLGSTTGFHLKGEAEDGYSALTTENDSGASFEDIAKIIEANPQGLFSDE